LHGFGLYLIQHEQGIRQMDKPTIQERRKFKRRSLSYYIPILDNNTQQVLGHLVDITSIGVMMDCKKNLPSGQDYSLRLNLPEEIAGKAFIEFLARCKWCRADKIQPFLYNAGFQIVSISSDDTEIIKKIAEKYGAG
jgi:hypothetical protein